MNPSKLLMTATPCWLRHSSAACLPRSRRTALLSSASASILMTLLTSGTRSRDPTGDRDPVIIRFLLSRNLVMAATAAWSNWGMRRRLNSSWMTSVTPMIVSKMPPQSHLIRYKVEPRRTTSSKVRTEDSSSRIKNEKWIAVKITFNFKLLKSYV